MSIIKLETTVMRDRQQSIEKLSDDFPAWRLFENGAGRIIAERTIVYRKVSDTEPGAVRAQIAEIEASLTPDDFPCRERDDLAEDKRKKRGD